MKTEAKKITKKSTDKARCEALISQIVAESRTAECQMTEALKLIREALKAAEGT